MSPRQWLRCWLKYLVFPGVDVAFQARVRRLTHYLDAGNLRTLDIGCGNGAFAFAAARKGNRVLGITIQPSEVTRCEEFRYFLGISPDRCRFQVMNAYDVVRLGPVDQILCFEVMEHLMRDDDVLATFSSILTPGGTLHISTPYYYRYYGTLSETEDGGHVRWGYTFEELERKLQKVGLVVIERALVLGRIGNWTLMLQQRLSQMLARAPRIAVEMLRGGLMLLYLPLLQLERPTLANTLCIYVKARRAGSASLHSCDHDVTIESFKARERSESSAG